MFLYICFFGVFFGIAASKKRKNNCFLTLSQNFGFGSHYFSFALIFNSHILVSNHFEILLKIKSDCLHRPCFTHSTVYFILSESLVKLWEFLPTKFSVLCLVILV